LVLGLGLAALLTLLALTSMAGADIGSTWSEIGLTAVGAGVGVGVILFGANVRSPGQLRALTGALQRAARGAAIVTGPTASLSAD